MIFNDECWKRIAKQIEQYNKSIGIVSNEWVKSTSHLTEFMDSIQEQIKPIGMMSEVWQNQIIKLTPNMQVPILMNHWKESTQNLIGIGSSLAKAMEPFNNTLANLATVHQEQIERMFQSIPRVSYDVNFENINLSYMNELASNIADENIDVESLVLTESAMQQVLNRIALATQGITLTLDEYLNILFKYAENAPTNIKIWVLGIAKKYIDTYIILALIAMNPVSPSDLAQHLNPSVAKVEISQQPSQQDLNILSHYEVKQSRVVRVQELNVRNEPNIDAVITGRIYFGCEVEEIRTDGDWVFVKWHGVDGIGVQGWVHSRCLSEIKEPLVE